MQIIHDMSKSIAKSKSFLRRPDDDHEAGVNHVAQKGADVRDVGDIFFAVDGIRTVWVLFWPAKHDES